jgi:hypothetical protein
MGAGLGAVGLAAGELWPVSDRPLLCAVDGWGRADRRPRASGSAWLRCWATRACCCVFGLHAHAALSWAERGEIGPSCFPFLDDLFCFENCANFVKL